MTLFLSLLTGETATTYHFKTLVPSVAAGAIIGKGGETIASLQKDAGARVKMSKSHDFYPGKLVTSTTTITLSIYSYPTKPSGIKSFIYSKDFNPFCCI